MNVVYIEWYTTAQHFLQQVMNVDQHKLMCDFYYIVFVPIYVLLAYVVEYVSCKL